MKDETKLMYDTVRSLSYRGIVKLCIEDDRYRRFLDDALDAFQDGILNALTDTSENNSYAEPYGSMETGTFYKYLRKWGVYGESAPELNHSEYVVIANITRINLLQYLCSL